MKLFTSVLAIGALLSLNGVVAAPARHQGEPVVYVTVTTTCTKVYGVTSTKWVNPKETSTESTSTSLTTYPTTTSTTSCTTTSTTTSEEESTSSTESASPTESTTSSTPSTTTTSSTSTTTEETTPTPTPTPTPPETTTNYPTPSEVQPPVTVNVPVQPSNKPEKSYGGGGGESFTGDATYYEPGLGSCGVYNGPGDLIAALSHVRMDAVDTGNPNNNPLCGKKLTCQREGGNPVTVTICDRCPGCDKDSVDFSPAAYEALGGTIAEGRFKVTCHFA